MIYIATIGDRTYEIEIKANGEITLDGQRLSVDFHSAADQPVYSLLLDSQSYEAIVFSTEVGLEVLLRGQLYQVVVEDERQRRLRQASSGQVALVGEYNLKAPMPGLVVAVPVEAEEKVEEGQILVVLESMKMQNELKAPRAGTVARVRVSAGDSVDQDQVLVTLT